MKHVCPRCMILLGVFSMLLGGCGASASKEDAPSQILIEETKNEASSVASPATAEAETEAAHSEVPETDITFSEEAFPASVIETKTATEAVASPPVESSVAQERTVYAEGFYYEPISDAIKDRIYGLSYKEDCTVPYEQLRYVSVQYVDFEGNTQTGELICNRAIAQDFVEIFYELYQASYPIEKIRLIDEYQADDDLSCLDNNTSCFNYRPVGGSSNLSKHALGLAIDINPFYNPYVTYPNGVERISPPGSEAYADRSLDFPYKIDENDLCYQLFTKHGFTWGGHWKSLKDYQHFQKVIS